METHTREIQVSLFDGRIDVLNRNAVEASPARQIFITASSILTLVRVNALAPHPSAGILLIASPGQED
jgi:hypothetical protein